MTPAEIQAVQACLRKLTGSSRLTIKAPARRGLPVELLAGEEVIGTVDRVEEEGELAYHITITILEEDLKRD
ncbi:MAG: DUF3126 family protein [Rhodovarius sp.]|nr:DUF3126 family protein [Rhodovarius sp.]MCX7932989.1 DUF3126 family protein [Rhodovarius sp.]MDW8314432.1 DUF3126 family protein [Rhodovarius sp.]